MSAHLKKIVVLGPESTGKSTLCEELAQHYNTIWCPEFAREYLLTHGKEYDYNDLLTIAKGQLALEDELAESGVGSPESGVSTPFFVDTNMYVMKVWCEFVFDNCHRFILEQIVERKYDLYLLCNTDLPWTPDELREYPELATRQRLYNMYEDLMINQDVPWVDISGDQDARLAKAIQATNELLRAV